METSRLMSQELFEGTREQAEEILKNVSLQGITDCEEYILRRFFDLKVPRDLSIKYEKMSCLEHNSILRQLRKRIVLEIPRVEVEKTLRP